MRFIILLSFLSLLICTTVQATHYRAGEIRVVQVGDCNDLTVEVSVFTYTKISGGSADADRQEIEVCWGDGTCSFEQRVIGIVPSPDVRSGWIQLLRGEE
ncbi:MAG: hypothetical protein AAF849_03100 [Bacteroidota bacterium]